MNMLDTKKPPYGGLLLNLDDLSLSGAQGGT